jgi:hypothetical protein
MSPVDWPVLFVAFIFTVVAERLISIGRVAGSKFTPTTIGSWVLSRGFASLSQRTCISELSIG